MAITQQTLQMIAQRRAALAAILADHELELVRAWVNAWDELGVTLEAALLDLAAQAKDGRVTAAQAGRSVRLSKALRLAEERLEALAQTASAATLAQLGRVVAEATDSQMRVALSQLPPEDAAGLGPDWVLVSQDAMDAIVARTTGDIVNRMNPLSANAARDMKRALVRGMAVGDNPRTVARQMLRNGEQAFNGGLNRALVVARTEMLDAHRAGGAAADKANADIMAGWLWSANLDARTCPSCLAQHGNLHPIDEPGPNDHQCGRCARVPKTKSWKELGFNIDEPDDLLPDSKAWFNGLDAGTQKDIMGAERLALLQAGDIGWDDLSVKRSTPGWRDAQHVTPVKDLRKRAAN